ncbi:uncharacterized protein TNCV_1945671 [Trichonephila clavipes]|nr:uncharacterized protein TNCV_1945671 [Trichonephila clavipes]
MTACNHMCCSSCSGTQEPIFNKTMLGFIRQGCHKTASALLLPFLGLPDPQIFSNRANLGSFMSANWASHEFERTRGKVTANMERDIIQNLYCKKPFTSTKHSFTITVGRSTPNKGYELEACNSLNAKCPTRRVVTPPKGGTPHSLRNTGLGKTSMETLEMLKYRDSSEIEYNGRVGRPSTSRNVEKSECVRKDRRQTLAQVAKAAHFLKTTFLEIYSL